MSTAAYLKFAIANRRFISFGFLVAFASSFGQTFFIGIFGPGFQQAFDLSHTAWGTVYMVGTLASAVLLPWTGRQIDRIDLRHYTIGVCLLLTVACAFVSRVAGVGALIVAIFLLRQSGQGLMSHVAVTSMARYFNAGRGRAIAIATLGFAAGEALLPFVAVLTIAAIGWRWTYGAAAALLALCLMPTALWLLKGHSERHRRHLAHLAGSASSGRLPRRSWTRAQVLADPRFYMLLQSVLAPSFIITAMFFHHLNLADAKGWTHAWITGSYIVYALATILTSLVSGPLIDRLGAVRLVPFMLVPLALGMVVVAVCIPPWTAWPYLMLLGIHVGIAHTAVAAMWAEIYGVIHLGAIKSLVTSLSVLGSALGPVTMGALMDLGMPIGTICLLFGGYAVLGSLLLTVALAGRYARQQPSI